MAVPRRGKNCSLPARRRATRGRILTFWIACVLVVWAAAFAQYNPNVVEGSAATPAEGTDASDKSKPASVVTPTSDATAAEAAEPLAPQAPEPEEPRTEAETPIQPQPVGSAEEAVVPDQALLPPEPTRKLWRITPLFSTGVLYDDNIFITNTNRVADVIWRISAGLAFELGDFRGGAENYLTAQWVGIPIFYTNNPQENSFDQFASLFAQYRWSKLVAQYEGLFSVVRESNREVNTITTTQTFSNTLRFRYDYSEKTSFDLQLLQLTERVEEFENNYLYEARAGMEYQILPKTRIGLEGAGGILDQSSGSLQYYQYMRVRADWAASGKLNVSLRAGFEAREFEGGDNTKISPIFSLGLYYQPFDGTTFRIIGYRNIIGASGLGGQDITATGVEIAATQRFFRKFSAQLSFGYENDAYFATTDESPTDRVDNYLYVRPRLSYSFVRWVSAAIFYEFRRNTSNEPESSFYNNRAGLELSTEF